MDTAFFLASKLVGLALRVEFWLLVLLVIGLWRRWARGLALAAIVALAFFPLGAPLVRALEMQHPPNPALPAQIDGIIVLGGGEHTTAFQLFDQPGMNHAGERLTAGAALALAHPEARLIFTGGTSDIGGRRDHTVPARMTIALWQSLGLDPARIEIEDRSRTTAENARLLHEVLSPQPGQSWILVTSAWHMPRALDSFERAGWEGLTPWPVDYRAAGRGVGFKLDLAEHLDELNLALKEIVGALGYRLAGR